ncbi:MAG: hypothetical protein CO140_02915 [Candidatus Moranbacteria bacterium CG_4_9_14_3_um_filter_40_7]|nr:MAG: hypothetical protein CO140_02915 [Candidatus Moranbacteria bacterium CG_4_9_14_3_um_filter_40_7]
MERKELAELINKIASHPRLSGSKNEQNAFKLIKNYIKNHIGGKTFLQKYQILTWRQKQDPCLEIDGKQIACKAVYYSPSVKLKGKLQYFQEDNIEVDNPLDIYCLKKGKYPTAFISLAKNFENPFVYNKGIMQYVIPDIIVGAKDKEFLTNSIGKAVSLNMKTKFVLKKTFNLVHKLSDRKGKFKLVIGAHMDTIPDFKGFIDNASGVAVALAISEKLKKEKLPFDVWIIYFGAEENSMFGSKYFVDMLSDKEREKVKFMISLDGVGLEEKTDIFVEEDYYSQIQKSFQKIEEKIYINSIKEAAELSDHHYFKIMGIDSCFIAGKIGKFYPHEKEFDSLENINLPVCADVAEAVSDFVKNIQFKSPDVEFDSNKRKNLLNFIRKYWMNF